MYQIKINGMPFSVPEGSTILEAARFAGIKIPTLCFLKDLNEIGACRVCRSKGSALFGRRLCTSCK